MMTCIAWGMDFITTNNPETLKVLLTRTFVSANSLPQGGAPVPGDFTRHPAVP